jgi:glyceraldehyde-3-phosphate dehydrogenase/erythrose-4-phosphate dehydrogenase
MDIHLDGTETTIIKALGLSGSTVDGKTLVERASGLMEAELLDAVQGLIDMGYVSCDTSGTLRTIKDMEETAFRVNSGYLKEIREALNPRAHEKKSKRVRRE